MSSTDEPGSPWEGCESPAPKGWVGGESPAPVRNPSPPKEVIGLSDSIGRTAFSKHWLFSTLMKLIKVSNWTASFFVDIDIGHQHAACCCANIGALPRHYYSHFSFTLIRAWE